MLALIDENIIDRQFKSDVFLESTIKTQARKFIHYLMHWRLDLLVIEREVRKFFTELNNEWKYGLSLHFII